jgi:hypothetical protein
MPKFRKKPVVIEAERVPPSKDLDHLADWGRLAGVIRARPESSKVMAQSNTREEL